MIRSGPSKYRGPCFTVIVGGEASTSISVPSIACSGLDRGLLKDAGTEIFAVDVGSGVNESKLTSIAPPGRFFRVSDFSVLEQAFLEIAGRLTFPAATALTFSASVPAGFTLVPGSEAATKGTVVLGSGAVSWTVDRLEGVR